MPPWDPSLPGFFARWPRHRSLASPRLAHESRPNIHGSGPSRERTLARRRSLAENISVWPGLCEAILRRFFMAEKLRPFARFKRAAQPSESSVTPSIMHALEASRTIRSTIARPISDSAALRIVANSQFRLRISSSTSAGASCTAGGRSGTGAAFFGFGVFS
jgi:hypothetical protein